MPTYYRRFVDDTLTIMPNKASADNFLDILNQYHSSINFTMEKESNGMLVVEAKVYVKPTNATES